jgi:hypothetical protein
MTMEQNMHELLVVVPAYPSPSMVRTKISLATYGSGIGERQRIKELHLLQTWASLAAGLYRRRPIVVRLDEM